MNAIPARATSAHSNARLPFPPAVFRQAVLRLPFRNMFCAAIIVLTASALAQAEEHIQTWIPDVLTFPDDAEVVMDRAVGSSVRLFSILTGADVDVVLARWEQDLNSNGYPVTQQADELLDRSIDFTGPGILNAKMIVVPTAEEGQTLFQFDATLN